MNKSHLKHKKSLLNRRRQDEAGKEAGKEAPKEAGKEADKEASKEAPKEEASKGATDNLIISGMKAKVQSPPLTACNQIVYFDGHLVPNIMDFRRSHPARMTLSMWMLSFFGESEQAGSLINAIDFHYLFGEPQTVPNAPTCVMLQSSFKRLSKTTTSIGFCFKDKETVTLFEDSMDEMKFCRENGFFPRVTDEEMDAFAQQAKTKKPCTPGKGDCPNFDDYVSLPPH